VLFAIAAHEKAITLLKIVDQSFFALHTTILAN